MNHIQEITKAVGAHGLWKQRITLAIKDGRSDTDPAHVEMDNQCDFGKWLYGLPSVDQNSEHFKRVKVLHANFHKEAAKVLRLAITGQKAAAEKSLDLGGAYAKSSSDLTLAMMNWKKVFGTA